MIFCRNCVYSLCIWFVNLCYPGTCVLGKANFRTIYICSYGHSANVWRHNHKSCSRTVTLKWVARMLRELGCVLLVSWCSSSLDWGFHGFIQYVQASSGLTLPFGFDRSPIQRSFRKRKIEPFSFLIHYGGLFAFVLYRFSSARLAVQLNVSIELFESSDTIQ
jgi:hypothetical protein